MNDACTQGQGEEGEAKKQEVAEGEWGQVLSSPPEPGAEHPQELRL